MSSHLRISSFIITIFLKEEYAVAVVMERLHCNQILAARLQG